jgi:hypothetical protein
MSARLRILAVALVAVAVCALPAAAEYYTITLKNGATFTTRYQPEDASWDPDKMIFLNEWGNSVSIVKDDVESISTSLENRGYGHMLNSTTIALGWAPNDAIDPDSEEGKAALEQQRLADAAAALAPPVYNQEQFVEPSAATGIPLSFVGAGNTTPPMGEPITAPPVSTPPGQ